MQKQYEEKFSKYIKENNIKAEQIFFENLVDHKENVVNTIKEKDISFNDIVKTIVFLDLNKKLEYGNAVVGIIPANSRVSKDKLKKESSSKIKISGPDEVLILTSYPAGGVPPFGFKARFYMDESLKDKNEVYAGGGSARTLVKTTIKEILKATKVEVVDIIE
ncbi:MAG: YbaK/EbsC family protein [Nanoarchaeota archaeon]